MKGLLLAAGLGTRLRPLTETVPKPALPLLNVPLGYWALYHLWEAGVTDLVVNTHYLPEKIQALFSSVQNMFETLKFSSEKEKILGSGGGIGFAKNLLGPSIFRKFLGGYEDQKNSFWVGNGDEVFLPSQKDCFKSAWQEHVQSDFLATIILTTHSEVGSIFGGVWCDSEMFVRGFGKKTPAADLKGYHYPGYLILNPRIFKYIPVGESNIFYDVMVKAIAAGEKVKGYYVAGLWFETGNIEDLKSAAQYLAGLKGKNQELDMILKTFSLKTERV